MYSKFDIFFIKISRNIFRFLINSDVIRLKDWNILKVFDQVKTMIFDDLGTKNFGISW